MGFSRLIAVVALAAAAVFAFLNQPLLLEPRTVAVPGGTFAVPLIGVLLGAAAGAVVLMLLGEAASDAAWGAARARLTRRLDERERELVDLRAGGVTEAERRIEDVRTDLSQRLDRLARLIEARFPSTTVHSTLRDAPDHDLVHRETTVTRHG